MTDLTAVKNTLRSLRIETPSWAYGNSGTRFKVFAQPGAATRPVRKIADAATVNRFTGCVPTVALHIPWDRVDQLRGPRGVRRRAGHRPSAPINANTFQDEDYRLGSVCNPDPRDPAQGHRPPAGVRRDRRAVGSRHPDAVVRRRHELRRPGLDHARARTASRRRSRETYAAMPESVTMLIEYKIFEPAFYSTDLPDWGTSLLHCQRLGDAGAGAGRHRPPRAEHEHRDDRGAAAPPGPARRLPLQQPLLRRRRPDGRLGRSVPAVPDHVRDRPGRRDLGAASPTCSTSATTSSPRWPARSAP